jgi:diguanylate cyclase (GGDEF)-like protein
MSIRYAAVSLLLCSALVATSALLAEEIGLGVTYVVIMALVSLVLIIGPAFEQGYLAQIALAESRTDSLTGIGNRRAVVSRLHEEISRCSRGSEPLAILMIDVDKLKEINDTDSHQAGDEALRGVAQVLRTSTRISDMVGRLGGDEFLVIAPATNEVTASALAERIAQDMRATRIPGLGDREIGLSIGIAVLPASALPDEDCVQGLLDRADRAMYAQKCRHYGIESPRPRTRPPLALGTMTTS